MERASHIFLVAVLILFLHCVNSNISTDRSSLLALKSRITLDPHNILTENWTNEAYICNWIGVTCDSLHKRVIELNISDMGFVGSIPPEMGNLSSLVSLDMDWNSFHGSIPPSIFNISSLQVLNLRGNGLSSNLPIDMCRYGLHNLKILRLSSNNLSGEIPSSLGQCSKLELLSFYSNSFDGDVPREIGNLTLLTSLYLGVNNLQGTIPKEICDLKRLEELWMDSNKFSGALPQEIGTMTALTELFLDNNTLTGCHGKTGLGRVSISQGCTSKQRRRPMKPASSVGHPRKSFGNGSEDLDLEGNEPIDRDSYRMQVQCQNSCSSSKENLNASSSAATPRKDASNECRRFRISFLYGC